jgi:hypothetical protein
VGEFTYQDSTGKAENYLDYDPNSITYVLVNAAKELKVENEHLQTRLTSLEGDLAQLRQMLLKDSPEKPSAARLYQNQPNPYHQTTTIKYFLPETAASARLKVFSAIGSEVFSKELIGKGGGEVKLSAQQFPAGIYVYQLIVDGRIVDSKKLILSQ